MRYRQSGFALIELLVVIGLISILTYIGFPYYKVYMRNASYRSAAREVASVMRVARTEAVTQNREQRLEIDLAQDCYRISLGNLARHSNDWEPDDPDVGWQEAPALVDLRAGNDPADPDDCAATSGTVDLRFYPDGTTSQAAAICVFSQENLRKFRTQLRFPTTGQVEVVR